GPSTLRARRLISCCRSSAPWLRASTVCKRHCGVQGRFAPRRERRRPRVVPPAIAELKEAHELSRHCQCRPCPHLNNVREQDHCFIKKRIARNLWRRSVERIANDRRVQGDEHDPKKTSSMAGQERHSRPAVVHRANIRNCRLAHYPKHQRPTVGLPLLFATDP